MIDGLQLGSALAVQRYPLNIKSLHSPLTGEATLSDSRFYRGLEVTLLIYRRTEVVGKRARNDDPRFDAAVRIREPATIATEPRSRVFKLDVSAPFGTVGDAHRASKAYAEQLIDACPANCTVFDADE